MSTEFFSCGLLIVSVFTSLTVEALKKIVKSKNYNLMAATVSVVLASAVSVGYLVYTSTEFTAPIGVEIIALVFLSFLSATVGYDKVMQAISQLEA